MLTSKTSDAWLALPTPPTSTSLASHSLPITLLPPPFATATAAPATVMVSFDGLPDPEAFDAALTRRTSTFKRKSAGAALGACISSLRPRVVHRLHVFNTR